MQRGRAIHDYDVLPTFDLRNNKETWEILEYISRNGGRWDERSLPGVPAPCSHTTIVGVSSDREWRTIRRVWILIQAKWRNGKGLDGRVSVRDSRVSGGLCRYGTADIVAFLLLLQCSCYLT